jgi:hypothetical protein
MSFHFEQFGLEGYGVGLGYGLPGSNGESFVGIGEVHETAVHEEMPGYPVQGVQHLFIFDPLGSYGVYQFLS